MKNLYNKLRCLLGLHDWKIIMTSQYVCARKGCSAKRLFIGGGW